MENPPRLSPRNWHTLYEPSKSDLHLAMRYIRLSNALTLLKTETLTLRVFGLVFVFRYHALNWVLKCVKNV